MRVFAALQLPSRFRSEAAAVSRILAQWCPGHYVPYENLHVTLAFLGEVGEAESSSAVDALEEACRGMVTVPLEPDGLGKFGRPRDATLWLGLRRGPELMGLAAEVRERLSARGLAFDDKPFLPHVTLARRVRLPRGDLPGLPFPQPDEATAVTLFKSVLGSSGATYKELHTVRLGS